MEFIMMVGYGFPMFGGIAMVIFWILLIGAIVWAVVYFSRSSSQSGSTAPRAETPLDILKRRFAAGEIDQAQFEEMKHSLS
jgi:putative membrane protein